MSSMRSCTRDGALAGSQSRQGLVICASAYTLLRSMLWTGANVFVSLVLTLLYVGASSLHHHARPHVWTLWLFAIATGLLIRDRRQPTRLIWLLIPLVVLWTNLHGGFLALVACLGLAAIGTLIENLPDWRKSLRYFGLTAALFGCIRHQPIRSCGCMRTLRITCNRASSTMLFRSFNLRCSVQRACGNSSSSSY